MPETQELAFDGSLIRAHEVAGQGYSQEATAAVPESLAAVFFSSTPSATGVLGRELPPRVAFVLDPHAQPRWLIDSVAPGLMRP